MTDGNVFFQDEDITNRTPEEIAAKGIIRTFQNIKLFKYLSALENVKAGCHIHTKTTFFDALLHTRQYKEDESYSQNRAMEVLEEVGLTEYRDWKAGNLP